MIDKEGVEPELVIREGEKAEQVIAQIKEDKEVAILILGGGTTGTGPGPLVTQLVTRSVNELTVPITVVPGTMSKEDIIAVS
jgi:nucleotide-binding universal stress UspA family protein